MNHLPESTLHQAKTLPLKPAPVALRGPRLHLYPAEPGRDARALHAISNGAAIVQGERHAPAYDADALIWRYMRYGPFAAVDEFAAYLADLCDAPDQLVFRIDLADHPQGIIAYQSNRPEHLKTELGHIWISPIAQGLRVIDEAAYLLLDHIFGLGYRRVEWKCNTLNARSEQVARRLGFTFEGVQAHHIIAKGRNRDTSWFRILDDEWPEIRTTLRARLGIEDDRA